MHLIRICSGSIILCLLYNGFYILFDFFRDLYYRFAFSKLLGHLHSIPCYVMALYWIRSYLNNLPISQVLLLAGDHNSLLTIHMKKKMALLEQNILFLYYMFTDLLISLIDD